MKPSACERFVARASRRAASTVVFVGQRHALPPIALKTLCGASFSLHAGFSRRIRDVFESVDVFACDVLSGDSDIDTNVDAARLVACATSLSELSAQT